MGLLLLPAHHLDPSTPRKILRASTPVHIRVIDHERTLVLGPRPALLSRKPCIDQRTWEQYQNHLARIPAWERAENYARQMEARHFRSHSAMERELGVGRGHVGRAIRLLDLPKPVLDYLKSHATPANIRFFTEKRLLELVRLGEARLIWREFQQLLADAEREAGIWTATKSEESNG